MRIHFRHLMLYEFRKRSSVTIATKNICAVYGENALSSRTCRKWFQRFRAGNFCLEDQERSGRPPQTNEDKIRDLVEKSPSLTVQEMSNVLKTPKTTIHRCLKKNGDGVKVERLGVQWTYGTEALQKNCLNLIGKFYHIPIFPRHCPIWLPPVQSITTFFSR